MLSREELTSVKDIEHCAAEIARVMYHTHQMLEAGAQSASHLPLTSLMIVCGHACAWASTEARDISAHTQGLKSDHS